jgi:1-aminocyclopropane-1-carboxylate deaminase/D-cysteine desulfhydrase-like pyridoxal-dependent ACC family enzyme
MIGIMQKINAATLAGLFPQIDTDILRLDQLHPVVSGNKWFKLKYYLQDAITQQKTTIATFGGAYSNHIVATAFAAKEAGLKSIGFIRGEKFPPADPHFTTCDGLWYGNYLCRQGNIPQ